MKTRKNLWIGLGACVVATLILTLLSPAEKTLGDLAKLVYLHGAIAAVALLMFAATVLLALAYLVTGRASIERWSAAVAKTAITYWVIYFISSLYVAWAAWGGILWSEPRLQVAIRVLFVSTIAVFLYNLLENKKLIAVVNFLLGGTVWTLRLMADRIFHPMNPVGGSGDLRMILFFSGLTLTLLLAAIVTATLWLPTNPQSD